MLGGFLYLRRAAFLDEVSAGTVAYLRPPGALAEKDFITKCIRCNQCADVCENNCIQFVSGSGADGTPMIRPREKGCILCMKCNNACPTGALMPIPDNNDAIRKSVRMGTAVVDKNICNSYNNAICGACIRACPFPEQALKTGMRERPVVDTDKCVGCGLCENGCIVYPQAIRVVPVSAPKKPGAK
ncbi:MAG: 4Fe-4S dicluster domain-containing protein [bacterium]|nr:4Fe-4S dicluster domain-containing protein [bacterium]